MMYVAISNRTVTLCQYKLPRLPFPVLQCWYEQESAEQVPPSLQASLKWRGICQIFKSEDWREETVLQKDFTGESNINCVMTASH